MPQETEIDIQLSAEQKRFAGIKPKLPPNQAQGTAVEDIVLMIEGLYEKIHQEITCERKAQSGLSDVQIENWSRQIEVLYDKVDKHPVRTMSDLRAKISLHLSLISKSFLDIHSVELHSAKILDVLYEYEDIAENTTLSLTCT